MGSNSSKCSKKQELYCFNDTVSCECPNGIPAPGNCTKKKPFKCAKCLPNYGNKDGKTFGGNNDIKHGEFNEYNNNVIGFKETTKPSSLEYQFEKNPNLESGNYSYFPNLPNSNERCDIIESIKIIKRKDRKDRNLEKLKLDCDEVLKDIFVKKMLNAASTSSDIDNILEESLKDGGQIEWTKYSEHLSNLDLYNILNRNKAEQTNTEELLKVYTECSNDRLNQNNKTIKQLLRQTSYINALDNDNKEKAEYANKRILELNIDNKTFYDHLFLFIKHLMYFGLILLALIWSKDKMLFIVFSILLILLITITIIVITNDLIAIYKNY